MTTYTPAVVVLPEYTDEALATQRVIAGDVAELLLTVPAEYRQPVMAEAHRRSTRTRWEPTSTGMRRAVVEMVSDPFEAQREVVAEVLAQLNRESA